MELRNLQGIDKLKHQYDKPSGDFLLSHSP